MQVQEHIPLRGKTTLKIGGTARYFVSVSTVPELREAVSFAQEKKLPCIILGGGSNVLVSDGVVNAVVIQNNLRGVTWKDEEKSVVVCAGAGENWDGLVEESVKRGLWGIENLSGIPGTVGAAPIQNIGAYGAEIRDVLEWVEALDAKSGKMRTLSNHECFFGYRDSIFKMPEGKSLIVTRVALRLFRNGKPNLAYKDLQNYFSSSYSPLTKGEKRIHGASQDLEHPSSDAKGVQLGYGALPTPPARGGVSNLQDGVVGAAGVLLMPSLFAIRRAVLEIRSKKFPDLHTHGTAGSFFKNPIISQKRFNALKKKYPGLPGFPVNTDKRGYANTLMHASNSLRIKDEGLRIKIPLAWILDNICGLKGHRKGNVALFERQPIVLVNLGGATAKKIKEFAEKVIRCVKEATGISVEYEVQEIA